MNLRDRLKNWGRFQTIATVLAKHGFAGLLSDLGFRTSSHAAESRGDAIPRNLRLAFEELGPTFVKLGQILSTRPDLLPESYVEEFSKLTDQATPFSFIDVKAILQKEFGRDPEEIFSNIAEQPIAAASISQVHRATLKDTGEAVVLKVQRPGILTNIQSDIQVLYTLAQALEKLKPDLKLFNLTGIVHEFQRTIQDEVDFTLEAKNIEKFGECFPNLEGISLPTVYWSVTTKRVLTMSELKGITISQLSTLPESVDRAYLAETLATFFFESMFFHGIFHADAHPGNILIDTEGRGSLALIDFGMVGQLAPMLRQKLSRLFMAVVAQDFESLAAIYADLGQAGRSFSLKSFESDIQDFLLPYIGRPLNSIPIGKLMMDSVKIARRYQIRLPRELILFYRALVTLEATGRRIDPDFEFLTYGKRFAQEIVRKNFSPQELYRDFVKFAEGIKILGTEVPIQLRALLRRLDRDSDQELNRRAIEQQARAQTVWALAFVASQLTLCATIVTSLASSLWLREILWVSAIAIWICFAWSFFRRSK